MESLSSSRRDDEDTNEAKLDADNLCKKCDPQIIKYLQETIQYMKQKHLQCNLKSIYQHLKQNYTDKCELIAALSEKDLMNQLELAVDEGILSRKFAPSNTTTKINCQMYHIPKLSSDSSSERHNLNLILQIVIKSMSVLNQQNFSDAVCEPSAADHLTCSLDQITTYLLKNYKFSENGDAELLLSRCVRHLLDKHDKIFIETSADQFKLNSVYVRQKLYPKSKETGSLDAKDVSVQQIERVLGIRPPYTAADIVRIERAKR
ncbi:hypothetical protein BpHYR1_029333, partial [Brachionus plicatilis]